MSSQAYSSLRAGFRTFGDKTIWHTLFKQMGSGIEMLGLKFRCYVFYNLTKTQFSQK